MTAIDFSGSSLNVPAAHKRPEVFVELTSNNAAAAMSDRDVPAVVVVKNEMAMLPHFLNYHRKLGLRPFFFVDNGSDDGTHEYLLQQDDCVVYRSLGSYREASFGMAWVNDVLARHCQNRWAVFVDCDEFLVYPDCETVAPFDFCSRIESQGYDCVVGTMLDLYPEGSFLSADIPPGTNILDYMNLFDTDYLFRPWPKRPWDTPSEKFHLQVLGGPRLRLLSDLSKEHRRGSLHYTLCNQVDRFIDRVPLSWVPMVASLWPVELPAQQKSPINFITAGFRFNDGHSNTNTTPANTTVALLHFKLCDELRKRLEQPTVLENHYRRGLSYEQLRQAIARWGDRSLAYPGTRKYRTSSDLLDAGLIGENVARLWSKPSVREVRTGRNA